MTEMRELPAVQYVHPILKYFRICHYFTRPFLDLATHAPISIPSPSTKISTVPFIN